MSKLLPYTLFGYPCYELDGLSPGELQIRDGAMLIIEQGPPTTIEELGCKLAAQMLLSSAGSRCIVVPSRDEWIGLGLLERDDELKRKT